MPSLWGDENQEVAEAWIVCNQCPGWYHKYCLGEDYENMSLQQIKLLNFVCKNCSTRGDKRNLK